MEVILLQDIYKHGVAGQVVVVKNGFARNYLIPRGMAIQATKGALRRTEKVREQVEVRRAAYDDKLNELARLIDGTELVFGRRAAPTGKLFGSVTTQEIADALLEATGVDINRRRISQQSLREIGTHAVPVRLGTDESPVLRIMIVREEELQDFLAARAKGTEAAAAGEGDAATEVEAAAPADGDLAPDAIVAGVVESLADDAVTAVEAAPEALPGDETDPTTA
jgi:large subunit ribosomal protein L9